MSPEDLIRCAFIQRLSSERRKAIIDPTSSGSPAHQSVVMLGVVAHHDCDEKAQGHDPWTSSSLAKYG
ncbi:hypothetical protein GRF59_02840 [Paenibacillus sp. HJL G12]|uniref:Uncharacterized protein n=1 Tax=Paenibacillus dendrobii TaxID=2691084 RepID=A0A7X3IFB1_9BACL|nr:hypothetical protein [Paenibacillus dendrobii]MWV42553.1 hypothetical protein [Paenibacillus dendrobii]